MPSMNFTVVTFGTEGDTRPLVAVCRGLMAAGHQVVLMADRSTLAPAAALGIPTRAMAGDMKATVGPGGALSRLTSQGNDPARMAKAVARIAADNTAQWMRDLAEQAQDADAILFSGIASYVGLSVAEYLGKPAIGLGLWPMSPTADFASPLVPPWPMPALLNRLSHHAMNGLLWQMFRKNINAARHQVFGQAPRNAMWSDYPILYGVSPQLVPPPSDWLPTWTICGSWYAAAPDWQPPAQLQAFLDTGPAPIYVGFGSMGGFDKQKTLSAIVDAIAGRRAIFFPGWSGIDPAQLPRNFLAVGDTAHDWLFPRMSMVIHHGGAGTTHTAARAGVPSIVIPFAGDQAFWGSRLAGAGIAPRPVAGTRIDARSLAAQIEQADRPQMRQRAKALATAMRDEDGVAAAVSQIEKILSTSGVKQGRS